MTGRKSNKIATVSFKLKQKDVTATFNKPPRFYNPAMPWLYDCNGREVAVGGFNPSPAFHCSTSASEDLHV